MSERSAQRNADLQEQETEPFTIDLPCVGRLRTFTVTEEMFESLGRDWRHIDVADQLTRLRDHLLANPHRQGAADQMPKRIIAWLERAVPGKPKAPAFSKRIQAMLRECVESGLVPPGFIPTGDNEAAQESSIRARATLTTMRQV